MKNIILFLFALLLLAAPLACGNGDDDDDNDNGNPADDDDNDNDDQTDDDNDDDSSPPDDDDDNDDNDDNDDDNDDDDTTPLCDWDAYNPPMIAGKAALADYDPATGLAAFETAAAICPVVGDAQLGILLAKFQAYLQALQALMAEYPEFPIIDWAAFQASLTDDLLPLNDELRDAANAVILNFSANRLYLSSFPLFLNGETVVVDCGGEWDYADVINLSALVNLFDAVERFFLAFHLEADWTLLSTLPYLYDPMEIIHYYAGQLLQMFADENYPDFMTFQDGGEAAFAEFATSLGFAAIDGQTGFDAVLLETDPQEDDITFYVDDNGNGQWDESENYGIPFYGPLADEMNDFLVSTLILMGDLGPALLDTGPEDLRPLAPDWLPLGDLNYILEALQAWVGGITLPDVPIPVGRWFYNPPDDGLRTVMIAVIQVLYDYTAPKEDGQ